MAAKGLARGKNWGCSKYIAAFFNNKNTHQKRWLENGIFCSDVSGVLEVIMLNKKNGLIASLLISTCLWASGALSSPIGVGGVPGGQGMAICCSCDGKSKWLWSPFRSLNDVVGMSKAQLTAVCKDTNNISYGGCPDNKGYMSDCNYKPAE